MSLVVHGYSESQLLMSLKELGLPYSVEEMGRIRDHLMERLNDFKRKELSENVFALFIDVYHTEVKDNLKVRKASVYIVYLLTEHQLYYLHLQRNVSRYTQTEKMEKPYPYP